MAKNQQSSNWGRSRTEQVMRFMLRRKPCAVLAIAEIVAILAFTAMVSALIYMLRLTRDHEKHIKDGIKLKEALSHRINLWHCKYDLPPRELSSFQLHSCHATVGPDAVAIAIQHTLTPDKCADILYEVTCHQAVEADRVKRQPNRTRPSSCAGLFGAPMPYELVSSEHEVFAPVITNDELNRFKGQMMFVEELVVKCPRCKVGSRYYSDSRDIIRESQVCRRQLDTIRLGWPSAAQHCDEEEITTVNLQKGVYC
uniref:Type II secretion system protein n=2 Tax=Parascaris univalens TaxID=6257 RepID=A0A914ZH08_PARUN